MAELQVDVARLEQLSVGFRTVALEMAECASQFAMRCGGIGEAYGTLPQSQEATRQYLAAVGSMSDHLTSLITEQQSHSGNLAASGKCYRTTQTDALAAIAERAAATGAAMGA